MNMRCIVVVNMDGPAFGGTCADVVDELREVLARLSREHDQLTGIVRNAGHEDTPRTIRLRDSSGEPCGRLTVSRT
jgi:hypothetical protein